MVNSSASEGGGDSESANQQQQQMSKSHLRRLQDRKAWEAYWQIRKIEAEGTYIGRWKLFGQRFIDWSVSWFREKIVEPLHDKYRMPYYHRKVSRVPEIDMCGVNDHTCIYEANEQFRLDKQVDYFILQTLRNRVDQCLFYHRNSPSYVECTPVMEDYEQADLNHFIKYGELGSEADVRDCYMKQKHRLIWERRHPEVLALRERQRQEYEEKKKRGVFDESFWKKGLLWMDKKNIEAAYAGEIPQKPIMDSDRPLSKDWEYYKRVAQDPEFDKEQGKQSRVTMTGR